MDSNDVWQEEEAEIEKVFVDYYSELFSSSNPIEFNEILEAVQLKVSRHMNEQLIKEFQLNKVVERENSWPVTSWHFILLSPQNAANYKAPCITARFCYHYSETNKNLPSVMQKPNHRSARVRDDTSSPARVSDVISNPAHVSDDTSRPIRLWHVSPIRLRHVLLTHPQTPINRSFPKAFQESWRRSWGELEETKIQKSRNFVGTKPWSHQELQLRIRRTFEEKSSKSSS